MDIWLRDSDLGETIARFPWLADGANDDDFHALWFLHDIAQTDLSLAITATAFPWLADDVTRDEWKALWALRDMATEDLELARTVTSLPWVVDGLTETEASPLQILAGIASKDLEFARAVMSVPWFLDGLTLHEWNTLNDLNPLARDDLDLANEVLELTNEVLTLPWVEGRWDRDLNQFLRWSLVNIANISGPNAFSQLTSQPWFTDGLSEAEAALVVTLRGAYVYDESLYPDLLRAHYSQTRTVSLPLAGETNIWVISTSPFPLDEDLLTAIEDTARISEEFLRMPFPTTDIILSVLDESYLTQGNYGGIYVTTHMRLTRFDDGLGGTHVPSVPHETAHYYFADELKGPTWFLEGGAEFIEAYVNHLTGVQNLEDRRIHVASQVQRCIEIDEVENILAIKTASTYSGRITCAYRMGENLFLALLDTIGEEAMRSALQELSQLTVDEETGYRTPLMKYLYGHEEELEDLIYRVFLEHTSPESREEFREMYRNLHGGPYRDPDADL